MLQESQSESLYFSLQGLVCAGLADMARPAEKLSTAQSAVLMATGKATLTLCFHTAPSQNLPSVLIHFYRKPSLKHTSSHFCCWMIILGQTLLVIKSVSFCNYVTVLYTCHNLELFSASCYKLGHECHPMILFIAVSELFCFRACNFEISPGYSDFFRTDY